jgi:hypothetical protein
VGSIRLWYETHVNTKDNYRREELCPDSTHDIRYIAKEPYDNKCQLNDMQNKMRFASSMVLNAHSWLHQTATRSFPISGASIRPSSKQLTSILAVYGMYMSV